MSDLISRQAAIDAIKRYESADSYDLNNGLILAMNAVADVPTIEPKKVVEDYCRPRNLMVVAAEDFRRFVEEPKHGKWIEPTREGCLTYDKAAYAECSECGKKEYLGWGKNYCPNCGAKMQRSEE